MQKRSSGRGRTTTNRAERAQPKPEQPARGLPRKTRVYVVDDHPVVRKGLQMLLDLQEDLQVCGSAIGVTTAKMGISSLFPDVVIVDLGLDDGDGFELMEWIRDTHPLTRSLVFTSRDDMVSPGLAFKCGAKGYVVKQDGTGELIRAIRLVLRGQTYVSTKITDQELRLRRPGENAPQPRP